MAARRLAAVPDKPGRAVAYIRVSALMGRGGDDFYSPELQLNAIRRSLSVAGLREVAVIDDDIDQTGRVFDRTGMDRIRLMVEQGQIDALAVFNVARFGRNVLEGLTMLAWLDKRGVQIISASEQLDTSTPAGRLMLTNMLAIAEYQSDEIGASWSRILVARAEKGLHHGPAPLGYTKVDGHLVVDAVVGLAVERAFRAYADGLPVSKVCAIIAAARPGVVTYRHSVKKMLAKPIYIGQIRFNGEYSAGAHVALVDDETWRRVQDRLLVDAKTPPRHLEYTWALVGLGHCEAGHPLTKNFDNAHGVDRLRCRARRGYQYGTVCQGIGTPPMAEIEDAVLAQVAEYVRKLRLDDGARAVSLARQAAAVTAQAELKAELTRVRAGMARLARAWAMQELPDESYANAMASLRAAESAAAMELARSAPVADPVPVEELTSAAQALLDLWSEMTPAERNRALRAVVRRVVVRRAAQWREPVADRVTVEFLW